MAFMKHQSTLSSSGPESIPVPKRRGRKPKGGTLIQPIDEISSHPTPKSSVIIQLKASASSVKQDKSLRYTPNVQQIQSYSEFIYNDQFEVYDSSCDTISLKHHDERHLTQHAIINEKLRALNNTFQSGQLSDKKCACFWCTCAFSNEPVYIPRLYTDTCIQVYGNFCSAECALAYLLAESIDDSTKAERCHLLNYTYGKIFNHTTCFKPAISPYYVLSKFHGSLSIDEYRNIHHLNKNYTIVEKPMTLINPEINDDYKQISVCQPK